MVILKWYNLYIFNHLHIHSVLYIIKRFVGPSPPNGTGYHRYCIFMMKTDAKINYPTPNTMANFNTTVFQQYVISKGGNVTVTLINYLIIDKQTMQHIKTKIIK